MEELEEGISGIESIGRTRNSCVEVLVEGDLFILDEQPYHVTSGEIQVFADGTIDKTNGEIAEVSPDAILHASMQSRPILNIDDLK